MTHKEITLYLAIMVNKVNISIYYPIQQSMMGIHKLNISKNISVKQLVAILRKNMKIDHLTDIHVHIEGKIPEKYYSEHGDDWLYLKKGDIVHLVSENYKIAD